MSVCLLVCLLVCLNALPQDTIKEVVNTLPTITRIQLPIPLVVIEVMKDPAANNNNRNRNGMMVESDEVEAEEREKTQHEIADALELWSIRKAHPEVQWLCSSVKGESGSDLMEVLQWVGSLYNSFLTIRTD